MDADELSVRAVIVRRVAEVLTGAGVAGGKVFRSRETPVRRGVTPAVVVRPAQEDDEPFSDVWDENRLVVAVEIHVRGDPYDELADPIATQVHRLITTAPTLAEISPSIRKRSTTWDGLDADAAAGIVTMHYQFTYLTDVADIAALV